MAQQAFPPLAHVEVHTSSVVPALVAEVGRLYVPVISDWEGVATSDCSQ